MNEVKRRKGQEKRIGVLEEQRRAKGEKKKEGKKEKTKRGLFERGDKVCTFWKEE